MKKFKKYLTLILFSSLSFGVVDYAFADPWHHGEMHHHDEHFRAHDFGIWHGGHWYHGPYGGRLGWYWIVGDAYYYYRAPIYPYPDPYTPSTVIIESQPAPQANPAPAATPSEAPAASVWYYCEASKGYYPYVKDCPAGWKKVPATPPGQ